jgi:multiple sugar transport system substrate-binding protein
VAALTRSPLSRRTLLRGLGAAALAPALGMPLAACGSDDSESGGGSGGGTVTFVYYGDAESQKAYDQLFTKFRS